MRDTKGQKREKGRDTSAEGQRRGEIKEQMEEIKRQTDGDRGRQREKLRNGRGDRK